MKKLILPLSIILLVVLIAAVYILISNNQSKSQNTQTAEPTNSLNNDNVSNSEVESQQSTEMNESSENSNPQPGKYITYSESALTEDINIIFFAASWCPSCRALDQDINSNLEDIPFNVTILKADYDKEQSLKVKYGITLQHTLVQVDKDGNEINKWNGLYNLNTLDDVLSLV